MTSAIVSAVIAGIFSVVCALIARSKGPSAPQPPPAAAGVAVSMAAPLPASPSRWLSWCCAIAWILPIAGFPFCLIGLGYALRDRNPSVGRRVPAYVIPLIVTALALTAINSAWGAYQGAHGELFFQHGQAS